MYCTRFSGSRFVHDPANRGIFIMGGTSYPAPWMRSSDSAYHANRFSISLPSKGSARGPELPDSVRTDLTKTVHRDKHPTFGAAVKCAIALRKNYPELRDCPIYACTDCLYESRSSAKVHVQLVSAP